MADKATEPDAEEQKQSGGMMKTLMMGLSMFIIVLLAQTIAPLISSKLGLAPAVRVLSEEATENGEDGEKAESAPIYWPLKPAMVVNFSGSADASFLQVEMEVMARDQAVIELVKEHMPVLRNSLLILLAGQTEEKVFTTTGKQALLAEALAEINSVLEPYIDENKVEAVYFTSFVAQ